MLNEGVHVEGVDGVVLLRPTVSPTLYLQQVGRALATGRGKGKQPVIFDIVNNFESLSSVDSLQGEFEQALALAPCGRGGAALSQNPFHVADELLDCRKLFRTIQRNLSSPWKLITRRQRLFTGGKGTWR